MRIAPFAVALLLVACDHRREPAPPPSHPPPPVAVDAAPAPPPDASPCAGLAARWEAALAAASLACTTDADCGCFNGGVSAQAGCGGVASAASVATLEALRDAYVAACSMTIQCGPWACQPRCDAGRCVN